MTKPKATTQKVAKQKSIESYQHADKKRVNNPPAGLVTPRTDPDAGGKKTYAYDGRSLYPNQAFFPMTDHKSGWTRLAKNLKAEIDQDLIEAYRGTTSLPFKIGKNSRVAVKIVDDRGVESLRVVGVSGEVA